MSERPFYSPPPAQLSTVPARLVLEDGSNFQGYRLGADRQEFGEVVFTTAMAGYQELLTDPSYRAQILVSTLAHVGNVGINAQDYESELCQVAGFVVADCPRRYSNWRAEKDLSSWLAERNVAGIWGVDTRALVRHIRQKGAMRGVISSDCGVSLAELHNRVLQSPAMEGRDLVAEVGWKEAPKTYPSSQKTAGYAGRFRVAAYDFGMKQNMLDLMSQEGLDVVRVAFNTSAREVLELGCQGVFLSNGPGDPAALGPIVAEIRQLLGKVPIFGICLGHQLLARALGASTYKLKFGHRGGNQPVLDLASGKVEITAQNHGFAVDVNGLDPRAQLSHLNLNDQTCEGIVAPELLAFSVQYHPESSPGPHDSRYLFERFTQNMEAFGQR